MPRPFGTTGAQQFATAPAVGVAGAMYFNTTSNTLFISDGTIWMTHVEITVGTTAPSNPAVGDLWVDTN
jgi:hypothetical protein